MELKDFIKNISTNYFVELEDNEIVLVPYNDVEYEVIKASQ